MAPGKNVTGINTASSTSAVAKIAPVNSFIALEAAAKGLSPASIRADTASTTTIASSTTRPVARITPSSVSSLIEKPNAFTKTIAPSNAIGSARAGTIVAFQSRRNRKMISSTNTTASRSASSAPKIEALMKSV